jgi:hypothetical protein
MNKNTMLEPFITLFSAPKPFLDPHIALIQKNAIQSWRQLGNKVEVVLIGEEQGVRQVAKDFGVKFIPDVRRNKEGTPLISSMFELARSVNHSPLMAIINTDIIVLPDFLDVSEKVSMQTEKFVLAGQRWDLNDKNAFQFKKGWETFIKEYLKKQGRRHPPAGSDYFIFPRTCYQSMPDFAIGRAGWDNWMIFKARWEHWKMIDATEVVTVIHQAHGYSHLPNGKTHHKIPETFENIRLAGGKRVIFTLADANYTLQGKKVARMKPNHQRVFREIEIWPLVQLHSFFLANISFWLTHPIKAHRESKTRRLNSVTNFPKG